MSLQYYGGKRIIDILRGKAFQNQNQHGELEIDPAKWGLILPANSTLKKYLPNIEPYKKLEDNKCQLLKNLITKNNFNDGGLTFDEIYFILFLF